jgi:hypothetical protein
MNSAGSTSLSSSRNEGLVSQDMRAEVKELPKKELDKALSIQVENLEKPQIKSK